MYGDYEYQSFPEIHGYLTACGPFHCNIWLKLTLEGHSNKEDEALQ